MGGAAEARVLTISTTGELNTSGTLSEQEGMGAPLVSVSQSNSNSERNNFSLVYTAYLSDDTYYIDVSAPDGGEYILHLDASISNEDYCPADANTSDADTLCVIMPGESAVGNIVTTTIDIDIWRLDFGDATSPVSLTVSLEGNLDDGLIQLSVRIYRAKDVEGPITSSNLALEHTARPAKTHTTLM